MQENPPRGEFEDCFVWFQKGITWRATKFEGARFREPPKCVQHGTGHACLLFGGRELIEFGRERQGSLQKVSLSRPGPQGPMVALLVVFLQTAKKGSSIWRNSQQDDSEKGEALISHVFG